MKRLTIVLIIALSLMGSPAGLIAAQITGGTIQGVVRNQLHEPVANAKVTSVNTGTNQSRSTLTDEEGRYRLPSLSVGSYEITIEADNYQSLVQRVTLRVNEESRVDLELQLVGSKEQAAVVGGRSAITESSNSVLGIVIENRQINELPLNGRNFATGRSGCQRELDGLTQERRRRWCSQRSVRRLRPAGSRAELSGRRGGQHEFALRQPVCASLHRCDSGIQDDYQPRPC
jgi:Carboxypeptidase regulatory-like domain